jgi:hypothetical protein
VIQYRWPSVGEWHNWSQSRRRALRRREGRSKRCERHMSRLSRAHMCRFVVSIVHGPLCSALSALRSALCALRSALCLITSKESGRR